MAPNIEKNRMHQYLTMMYELASNCMTLHITAVISQKIVPVLYPFKIAKKGTN
jgi:hypothetical protein